MNPWQIFKLQLESDINGLRDDLENAKDWDDYNQIKGRLEQARQMLTFVHDSKKDS